MICDGKGNVLVQDKKSKSWGGICFPGGHVEEGESFFSSVIREIREETGLEITSPKLCGVKQFCDGDERYIVFLYRTDSFSGEIQSSEEGRIFWMPRQDLEKSNLAPRFMDMVRVFENDELDEVHYIRDCDGNVSTKFF
jgi:8-oxo-dGTP diphosphatase